MKINRPVSAFIAGSAALSLVLAGCSTDSGKDKATSAASEATSTSASASSEQSSTAAVTFSDAYIKEKPADKMMTGIFGVLKNNTDKEISLKDFSVEGLKEGTVFEQHDVKDGKMFKIDGGHVIPAKGEFTLMPGGPHLMIMKNMEPMEQGKEFKVILNFSDGSSITQSVPVRVQPSGEENYGGDGKLQNPDHKGAGEMSEGMDQMGHEGHEGHHH